jgi:hypothetical protein
MKIEVLLKRILEGISLLHRHKDQSKATVDLWFNLNGLDFIITMRRPSVRDYSNLEAARSKDRNDESET